MPNRKQQSYLIVNADDYGYFDFVSKGILQAAKSGVLTATGIIANSMNLMEQIVWLNDAPSLDLGVHLNLTDGKPLTLDMQKALSHSNGLFPGKFPIAKSILLGNISLKTVEMEWRKQIEICLYAGLNINFLNSHEHIHMLPNLFKLTYKLAKEYKIKHIRLTTPEYTKGLSGSSFVRDPIMLLLSVHNKTQVKMPFVRLLGMGKSGKLDLAYLKQCFMRMQPGKIYELMCHPGSYNNEKILNQSLLKYHDWNGELRALTHPSVADILSEYNIKLITYRDLVCDGEQLKARRPEEMN